MTPFKKTVKTIVIIPICAAIVFVSKLMLFFVPNIELVTFLLIIYSLVFKFREAILISTIYTLVEMWLFSLSEQFYIWNLIVIVTFIFKNIIKKNFTGWAIFSGFFGLIFGTLSAIPFFIFFDFFSRNIDKSAVSLSIGGYILSGLWLDAVHMLGNFFIMLFLGELVYKKLQTLLNEYYK